LGPQVNTFLYGVLTFQYASYYNTGESQATILLDQVLTARQLAFNDALWIRSVSSLTMRSP
jgi:hypothetical protein